MKFCEVHENKAVTFTLPPVVILAFQGFLAMYGPMLVTQGTTLINAEIASLAAKFKLSDAAVQALQQIASEALSALAASLGIKTSN